MSWLDKVLPPKIKNRSKSEVASNVPEGLWHKCPACSATTYSTELQQSHQAHPKCNHHNPLSARERPNLLLDEGSGEETGTNVKPTDPLKLKDSKKYSNRLAAVRKATGEGDMLVVVKGMMDGLPVVVAAFEFRFIGGSVGSVVGERLVQDVRRAVADSYPSICVAASGGARMQEGVNSSIQMTKTSVVLHLLTEKGLPFIPVLTDSMMGGAPASFVFLGGTVLVEPNALIGFAGSRIIEQAMRETLSEGFQQAEFLLEKGVIGQIVNRRPMEQRICDLITLLCRKDKVGTVQIE